MMAENEWLLRNGDDEEKSGQVAELEDEVVQLQAEMIAMNRRFFRG